MRLRAALAAVATVVAVGLAAGAAWAGGADSGAQTTPLSLGVNTAAWDGNFLDADIPPLLQAIRTGVLRYPGGSYADYYDWQTNTANGQSNAVDWQQFSSIAEQIGADPFVTVNYGSGTPAQAAAWVSAARSDPRLRSTLWEIGNEEYGPWETDDHPDPHTPASFAANAAPFLQAMHAADPQARIGFPYALTAEQAAGTGTGVADPDAWNRTILRRDGRQLAFADVHWYPFYGTPSLTSSQIVESVGKIPDVMRSIRATLAAEGSHAAVVVGESNISNAEIADNVEPVAALYAAGTALEWLSQGARSFDWWDLHNYGTPEGDFGLLSSGTSGEPAVDTPFPAYFGYELASMLTVPGSRLTAVPTDSPATLEFTSRRQGRTTVMLINGDSSSPATVRLDGRLGGGTVQTDSYSQAAPRITTGTTSGRQIAAGVTLAPESIEVLAGDAGGSQSRR